MTLTLLPFEDDDLIRVHCQGRISTVGHPDGTDPLQQLLGAKVFSRQVLLDLHDSPGADTSGIAWLARSTERFARAGGTLVLVTVPPSVEQIVTVLGLGELFHAARTDAEALAVVRNGHPAANGRATAGRVDHTSDSE